MNIPKCHTIVSWFGIPLWKGKPRDFVTRTTTLNWNSFHENLENRRSKLIATINSTKDKKALEILRNNLLKLGEEQAVFRNSHIIDD